MQPKPLQFGKYVLLEPLAKGGMAETYRARFTGAAGVTKHVVIKRILPVYADDKSFMEMFVNEAKIAASLSHGNIAQVFDFGELDGQYFLAMELVDGQSLFQVLKRSKQLGLKTIPEPIAVLIAMRICDGLHYAHTRLAEDGRPLNIIHRDVTPENVLISYEGQVKLVDFGIAKARTGHSATEPGMVKGKYLYLSPEQARGEVLDARTDLFAAGVVLYSMLCGRLPFEGAMVQVMRQVAMEPVPAPRSVNPNLSPDLERILLRALAMKRGDRYANAQEFAQALSSYLYRDEPTFSQTRVASFMSYLFESTLAAEGRTIDKVTNEFLRQLETWRMPKVAEVPPPRKGNPRNRPEPPKGPPSGAGPPDPEVTAKRPVLARADTEKTLSPPLTTDAMPVPAARRPLARTALLGGLFLIAVLVSLGLVKSWKEHSTALVAVQVKSTPPGAAVELDGQRILEVTPLTLPAVTLEKHRLALYLEGSRPWSTEFTPTSSGPSVVEATLDPLAPPAPAPPVPTPAPAEEAAPAQATAESSRPPNEAVFPVPSFKVWANQHRFSVAGDPRASVLELDPSERYRLSTEGSLKLDKDLKQSTRSVFYVVKGTNGAPDGVGMAGSKPVVIEHASALYGLVLDPDWENNEGAVTLRLQTESGRRLTLMVDARKNALEVPARKKFILSGLDRRQHYELAVRPVVVGAEERPGKLACAAVLREQQDAVTDGQQLLEAGGSYKVGDADAVQCTFLEAGGEGGRGALEVEVRPWAPGHDPAAIPVLRGR